MINAATILTELQLFTFAAVSAQKCYTEREALECAEAVFDCLYQNFKTRQLYIPSPAATDRKQVYQRIYDDFNGHNHHVLAIRYKRSLQNIYKVINLMRTQHIRERQVSLFDLNEDKDSRVISIYVIEEYLPSAFIKSGLQDDYATDLAQQISKHACESYPGISVPMPESLAKKAKQKRKQCNQTDLFLGD